MTLKLHFFSAKNIQLGKMANDLEISIGDEEESKEEGKGDKLRPWRRANRKK